MRLPIRPMAMFSIALPIMVCVVFRAAMHFRNMATWKMLVPFGGP